MLTGVIFEKETIISMDLNNLLSGYCTVVNIKNKTDLLDIPDADFILIDSDSFTIKELCHLLHSWHINPNTRIIILTSDVKGIKTSVECNQIISKPYSDELILDAISQYH